VSAPTAAGRRFWVEFDVALAEALPAGCHEGVGVTADDEAAALAAIRATLFGGRALPPLRRVVVDVETTDLCPWLVLPAMADWSRPGVWFPPVTGR
jgi:hypothetical protein